MSECWLPWGIGFLAFALLLVQASGGVYMTATSSTWHQYSAVMVVLAIVGVLGIAARLFTLVRSKPATK